MWRYVKSTSLQLTPQWLSLIKPNHDVNVRLSDHIPLDGFPQECNLLAVSNIWGLIVVGTAKGMFSYLRSLKSKLMARCPYLSAVRIPYATRACSQGRHSDRYTHTGDITPGSAYMVKTSNERGATPSVHCWRFWPSRIPASRHPARPYLTSPFLYRQHPLSAY